MRIDRADSWPHYFESWSRCMRDTRTGSGSDAFSTTARRRRRRSCACQTHQRRNTRVNIDPSRAKNRIEPKTLCCQPRHTNKQKEFKQQSIRCMLTLEHFVTSYSLALVLVLLGSYLTSTTGTPSSWDGQTGDGYITPSHLLRYFLYYSLSSGALLLLHLRLDGII